MMLAPKLAVARAARRASRALRRGGTVVPGRVLLRLEPRAIAMLAPRLGRGSVVISATNGKTTTAAMLAAVLQGAGVGLVHNRTGSNMDGGVATAMLDARPGGGELGLFEVDEAWLPAVARDLRPHTFLLSNLFRDQLDRYGELAVLAERWSEMVDEQSERARLVLNADDPLVADLGRGRPPAQVLYFGVADDSLALPELQHAADSKGCGHCGHAYAYEAAYLAHLGRYACPNCGQRRPEPEVVADRVVLHGMSGSIVHVRTPAGALELELPLPGLYNVYNALAATATAVSLGIPLDRVKAGLEGAQAAFGRVETLEIGGRAVSIMLVKNPAGANEVLRTLALEDGELELWIALNDRVADGRDVSWMWDADFEGVAARIGRVTCSGTRAEEMALRMKYAGVTAPIVVDRDLGRSLDAAVAAGDGRALYALPTYTALLELRGLLADRGVAPRWSA
ncbi:MAG: proposed amino acid ligase found clustered with an amidotransferase [uncultured Solirubrobacterales bacterium]|uniref:Lipid II isoglutaminyl synthase (glutamine-hydrolyzing) subunit MurT n=1 Tax=uncultured Solirubrobacterales bacterium TaxID=768556 RepID=A0A6J4S3G3_9ACTN|nr:MAG: proposed amino acid ligase found clustered with an amidotransferase [uncultured Solirubrobacterales bacterium]